MAKKTSDPAEHVVKPTLPGEQKVAVVGSLNHAFMEAVRRAAKRTGVQMVVELEEEVALEAFKLRENPEYDDKAQAQRVKDYVADENNRKVCEEQARKLWDILTNGNVPITDHDKHFFNGSQVAKYTNLSHSKAKQVLDSLALMGYVRWTNDRKGGFQFDFTVEDMIDHLRVVLLNNCKLVTSVIARYEGVIDSHPDWTKEEKESQYDEIYRILNEHIICGK